LVPSDLRKRSQRARGGSAVCRCSRRSARLVPHLFPKYSKARGFPRIRNAASQGKSCAVREVVVVPRRTPPSTSACRTQLRRARGCAKLLGHPSDRALLRRRVLAELHRHPSGRLTQLVGVLPGCCHDSHPPWTESLHKARGDSPSLVFSLPTCRNSSIGDSTISRWRPSMAQRQPMNETSESDS